MHANQASVDSLSILVAASPDASPEKPANEWLLWQLADSAFPIGGFSHSAGLEAAVQHGYVRTSKDVAEFAVQALKQTVRATLPFVLATFDDPDAAFELDHRLNATLSNHVANRASRAQGQMLLATVARVFSMPAIAAWRERALATDAPAHFAIVFGLITHSLGLDREKIVRLFLFTTLRGLLSAAVRLNVVGPLQAQEIQLALTDELEILTRQAQCISIDAAVQTSPLIELLQSTQDRLYSRLFQS